MINVSNDFKTRTKKIKQQNIKLGILNGELTVKEVHFMPVNVFNKLPVWMLRKRQEVIAKELKYSFDGKLFKTIMKQIEITVKNAVELKDKNVNFKYGIYVNNKFEYIDLGDFYIKDIDDDKGKKELVVTGYDKMIHFMKTFKQSDLQLTYPCTMLTLIQKMCEVCGVELYSTDFFNADLQVDEDYFTAQELTYRDVLEKVAESTETTIFIKDNKLYLHKLADNPVEKLDASYLTGLTVKEKFGPVNALVLGRGDVEDNVEAKDDTSIAENGRCEIRFNENEFVEYKREQVIDEMFEQIKGLEYYAFEGSDVGVMWLEPCDLIEVEDTEESTYKTIYLTANITINTGIGNDIEADIPEETNTEYKVTTKEEKKTLKVERLAKKNEGFIQDLIQETTEHSQKITKVEQDIYSINQEVKNIQDFEREITERNEVHLNETILGEGYVLNLKIKGNTSNFKYLAPSDTLVPNSTLAPYGDHITLIADKRGRTAPTEEAKEIDIRLEEPLRNLEDVYDELNIADGKCIVTRRIGVDENLELYVLETEGIEEIGYIYIPTFEGNTYLYIKEYYNLEYTAKYIKENEYSEVFATNVELNSKIEQTSKSIKQEVNKKVGKEEFGTLIEQNAEAVKYAWNQISEYLQMEVLKGNVSLVVRGENQKLLMSLDKNGQNFYKDNEELLGEMGIQRVDETDYVAFSVPSDYNQTIESGMAWGLTTTSDNKFHPILYVKNFAIENEQSDAWYGQIVLQNSDLVLASLESGIVIGNVRIYGNFLNGIVFEDINTGIVILNINPSNNAMPGYQNGQINILDKISFYANQAGSNTMKIGAEEHYCLMTDDGYLSCDELYAENEISCNTLRAFGHIYCNNGVEPFSLSEKKRNIQKYNNKAIEEVKKTDIFYYNYKEDKENCKKRVGAVIGSDYNCSEEIIGTEGKGIDLYSMISVAYKALQEQQEIIEKQEERITKLEGVINNEKNSV